MSRIDSYLRAIDDDRIREYWDRQDKLRKARNKKKGEKKIVGEERR